MIDYDFEERLHRRLDARQAIAGLRPRDRSILAALYRHGDTQAVVAREWGISQGRVGQIRDKTLRRLRYGLERSVRLRPAAVPLRLPQHGFDKAAFLAHMRELHALREQERADKAAWAADAPARAWECELKTLRCQIAREAERQQAARQREADEAARREREQAEQAARQARWEAFQAAAAEWQRQQREEAEEATRSYEAAHARQLAFEDELRAGIMPAWNALVARKGWSEGEAQTHWHEWLTGPPGWFG